MSDNSELKPLLAPYLALSQASGLVELPNSSVVRLRGDDRDRFLHNFCTAEVKELKVGKTNEAFFLNQKGKTISHGFINKLEDSLLIWTVDSEPEKLVEFLDRYLLSESVEITIESTDWRKFFICGPNAGEVIQSTFEAAPAVGDNQTEESKFVTHIEVAGLGYLALVQQQEADSFVEDSVKAGAVVCDLQTLEAIRIENLTPWFAHEIDDSNLPQELMRDEKAISFTKGCYLGQETVARLDAMGHVNRCMVGLTLETESQIQPGDSFELEGKKIGRVTSVAWSPKHSTKIGLGFVRKKLATAGTEIQHAGEVVIVGF